MFDVKNVSEWRDLKITEVHVAGALRRVRVYVCFGSHSTAQGGWELVADQHCAESWYEPTRIRLMVTAAQQGIPSRCYLRYLILRLALGRRPRTRRPGGGATTTACPSRRSLTHVTDAFVGGWWRRRAAPPAAFRMSCPRPWSPKGTRAPAEFKAATLAILCAANRPESPLAVLPPELVIKILESLFDASYSAEAFTPPASPPKSRLGRWASAATHMLSNLAL